MSTKLADGQMGSLASAFDTGSINEGPPVALSDLSCFTLLNLTKGSCEARRRRCIFHKQLPRSRWEKFIKLHVEQNASREIYRKSKYEAKEVDKALLVSLLSHRKYVATTPINTNSECDWEKMCPVDLKHVTLRKHTHTHSQSLRSHELSQFQCRL